jgi:dipeptide/tripeptide permease
VDIFELWRVYGERIIHEPNRSFTRIQGCTQKIYGTYDGGWMLTTSLGGKISGILAGFWDQFDDKAVFFGISAVAALVAGLIIFPITKKLNKVVIEATASED